MPRHLLLLDFETYYDNEYSLKRMTPAEYILDPRYETIMCAVKAISDTAPCPHTVVDAPDFPKWLAQYPPQETTTVTFNALFDNSILAWHYGYVPHTMIDAMAMARTLLGHELVRFNLASIAEHFGAPPKQTAIHDVKGMRRDQIKANPILWHSFSEYAKHDNELCELIFTKLYDKMPWSERRLMDLVLRCCVEPRFVVDTKLLDDHIGDVRKAKDALILAAGSVDKSIIMSSVKFKAALEQLGVDVKLKDSPTAKDEYGDPKQVPAFAKTDEFMEELLNSDDGQVAALAAARIGLKSTLEETRSGTLMRIGNLPWQTYRDGMPRLYSGGTMPIPLRYGGAHTHRLSGDWGMNMQNMPRPKKDANGNEISKLRLSLKAPPGHKVITCDLGQIEARLVAWICGAVTLIEQFAKYDAGDKSYDPYNRLASAIFGRPVNRKLKGTLDEIMGFIGKTGILGLGYGCGKEHFDTMVIRGARTQNVDISQLYTRAIGDKGVDTYRQQFFQIPVGWRKLGNIIGLNWATPGYGPVKFGPVIIEHGVVHLPSGLDLTYAEPTTKNVQRPFMLPNGDMELRWVQDYIYRYGKMWHRLYGPKLLENIVQALARIIVMNAALRIRDRGKMRPCPEAYRFVLQAHDELVFIVPDAELAFAKQLIHQEMVRPPSWGRDIPLTADIGMGASYGEAK